MKYGYFDDKNREYVIERPRSLTLTGYAEFTNHSNYEQDQVNLQYSLFIGRTLFAGNRVVQQVHGNLDALPPEEQVDGKIVTERFFGLSGAPVAAYCGDKASFLGGYRSYGNPIGVERGMENELSYNENACGALSCVLTLEPGESRTVAFLLGEKYAEEAEALLSQYENSAETVAQELSALKEDWEGRLSALQVQTPDPAFNSMLNTWNAYNCYMTFIWSRAASFIYCGLRNGYGYRDTVQDIQGVIHLVPEMAAEKLRFMLTAQVDNGGGLPLVKFTHNPGHEDTPDDASYVQETGHPAYRADDALWLFPTVYKYLTETGNTAFLDEVLPFANHGEASVYEHLKRAIQFSLDHLGPHGLPAGLYADWNDCLRLGVQGESSFVAMQFYYALVIQKRLADWKGDADYSAALSAQTETYSRRIQQLCWDGDRFIRGFTEKGERIGAAADPEANLWLNPQSWSVISTLADHAQAERSMEQVHARLNTPYGAELMDPPYHAHAFDGALAVIYNPGVKENAGIFSQSQGWLILAEALLGHGERAFEYFLENAPAAQNDRAEVRVLEPYCYGQFTEGRNSPHFGRSHVHWLTGTASTVMVGCVEGILGLRPDLGGLRLEPAVPGSWKEFTMDKCFRGKKLHIRVENPEGRQSGFHGLWLNGEALSAPYLPSELLKEENEVLLRM